MPFVEAKRTVRPVCASGNDKDANLPTERFRLFPVVCSKVPWRLSAFHFNPDISGAGRSILHPKDSVTTGFTTVNA